MNPEDIAKILDDLGQRLGPAGEHVFQLAVRQQYVEAATATVFLILTLTVGALFLKKIIPWVNNDPDRYGSRGDVGFFLGIASVMFVVLGIINAFLVIPDVFNPEYAAIRDLLVHISQ